MNFSISQAKPEDTPGLVGLLNAVTERLHQRAIHQWNDPWKADAIEADIVRNSVFLLWEPERIIGTYSFKTLESNPWRSKNRSQSLYLYRIALHPDYQGKAIGKKLVFHALAMGRRQRMEVWLDCWAGNEKLKQFYRAAGFLHAGDFPEEDYRISVFYFPLPSSARVPASPKDS